MKTRNNTVAQSFFRLLLLTIIAFACQGYAAPYGPNGMASEWVQPDGAKLDLRVFGDEFYARTETLDGYTVVFDSAKNAYYYAALSQNGQDLVSSGVAVGNGDPKALRVPKRLAIPAAAAKAKALPRVEKWEQGTQTRARWNDLKAQRRPFEKAKAEGSPALAPPGSTTVGNKVGLTLLIDFSDDPATIPQANVVDFCNGDSYTGYGNNGSVKKYFQDNSNNLLTYTNTVTAYIRMAQPKSYYNNTSLDCGAQGRLLISDAIDIMKALPNYTTEILPTFSTLTVDSSNRAVACSVFFAGNNSGVWSYGLWPHSWVLAADKELSPGGKKVFYYQITNLGSSLELGTFCHENGHMLCDFPDIYDYGYDSIGGAGGFCLMNSGGHGANPTLICAYLKRAAGWTTETNLTSSSALVGNLASAVGAAGYNAIYRYAKPGVSTEYFLFENRQKTGRDANIAASGVAVWHVDELGNKDNQSMVPNTTHANYEVTLEQADNLWHFQNDSNSGDAQDLYYLGNTAAAYTNAFSDSTSPNAHWWDGTNSGCVATNFSAAGANMTVQFGVSLPPNTIVVNYPNGGESIYSGSTKTVTWSSNTAGNVKIDLYKGGVLNTVLSASEANDGSYSWVVSSGLPAGSDYTIKISSVANPAYSDSSNAPFSISTLPVSFVEQFETGLSSDVVYASPGATISLATGDWYGLNLSSPIGTSGIFPGNTSVFTADTSGLTSYAAMNYNNGSGISNISTFLMSPTRTFNNGDTISFLTRTASTSYPDRLRLLLSKNGASTNAADFTTTLLSVNEGLTTTGYPTTWTLYTATISGLGSPTAGRFAFNYNVTNGGPSGANSDYIGIDVVTYTAAVVSLPEIAVEQPAGTNIADGGTKMFANTTVGTNSSLVFTIKNTGPGTLSGLSITKDGTNAADFTVTANPAASVSPGGSTTFTVRFTPTGSGSRTAAIHIANNDADENPYDITLKGWGLAAPEIAVQQPWGTAIADGGTKVFANTNVGANSSLVFTIRNTGGGNLTGLAITKNGTNAADFTVTVNPVAPVIPGGSTTFTVRFAPTGTGSRTAAIHIASNDADENPYDITLKGWGLGAPEIAVEQPVGTAIADGGTKVFGNTTVGTNRSLFFTIKNTGGANLTGLAITKNGTNPADFTVMTNPAASVSPGGTTNFTVRFAPTGTGSRSAAIHIASNDANENPYDITLTGWGLAAAPGIASVFDSLLSEPAAGARDVVKTTTVTEVADGQKYQALVVAKAPGTARQPRIIEVSPNLLDWYSGGNHTTILQNDAEFLKVRDNTPITPGVKRYIRLKDE